MRKVSFVRRSALTLLFVIARHRREGGGSYRASCMTPALLKPPPLPIRRRPPSFTPKMAAHFLEAVRNRRVNIGRSISVFGRVERDGGMPWVIQASCNGTRNHKNLVQHTLTPTSARVPFSSLRPFSNNYTCVCAHVRVCAFIYARLCTLRYRLAKWLPHTHNTPYNNGSREALARTRKRRLRLLGVWGLDRGWRAVSLQIIGTATNVCAIWPTISL